MCLIFAIAILTPIIVALVFLNRWREKQMLDETKVKNKGVVVSGCDSGFGRALAYRLSNLNFTVFAFCLTKEAVDELSEEKESNKGMILPVQCDVTNQDSIDRAYHVVTEKLGTAELWALVNNAGTSCVPAPDDWQTIADFQQQMAVNFFGMVRMCHRFKKLLKQSKGRIVNTTSISGRIALDNMGPYSCAKFAGEAYSDTIRGELADFGVTVHIVEPGGFKTPAVGKIVDKNLLKRWLQLSQEVKGEYGEEYFKKLLATRQANIANFLEDLSPVIDAYTHALTAKYPKARYTPPDSLQLKIALLMSAMPTCIQQWMNSYLKSLSANVPRSVLEQKT